MSLVAELADLVAGILAAQRDMAELEARLGEMASKISNVFRAKFSKLAKELGVRGRTRLAAGARVSGKLKVGATHEDVSYVNVAITPRGRVTVAFYREAGKSRRRGVVRSVCLTSLTEEDLRFLMENLDPVMSMLREALRAKESELSEKRELLEGVLRSASEVMAV